MLHPITRPAQVPVISLHEVLVPKLPYSSRTSDWAAVTITRFTRINGGQAVKITFGTESPDRICFLSSAGLREVAQLFGELADALDVEAANKLQPPAPAGSSA